MVGDNHILYCSVLRVSNTDKTTRRCPIKKTIDCCLMSSEHYCGKIYDEFTNNKSTRSTMSAR